MKGIHKFLLVTGVSIIVIGLLYGVSPERILGSIVGLSIQANELHIFRAIMGLYCGIGGLLVLGAVYQEFTKPALLLETVFFGSLASGRIISLVVDGGFHWFVLSAVAIEVPLFLACLILFKNQNKPSNSPDSTVT